MPQVWTYSIIYTAPHMRGADTITGEVVASNAIAALAVIGGIGATCDEDAAPMIPAHADVVTINLIGD